jgi:hypothetical protein
MFKRLWQLLKWTSGLIWILVRLFLEAIALSILAWFCYTVYKYDLSQTKEKIGGCWLYACGGTQLYSLDLTTYQEKILLSDWYAGNIYSLGKFSQDWILVEQRGKIRPNSEKDSFNIFKFNIKTREKIYLREGRKPLYLAKPRKLLFFIDELIKVDGAKQLRGLLYVVDDLSYPEQSRMVMRLTSNVDYSEIIQVSDDEVVFTGRIDKDGYEVDVTYLYNAAKDSLIELDFGSKYIPKMWRDKSKQLLCYERGLKGRTGRYIDPVLISLDGEQVEKAKVGNGVYMRERDAVLRAECYLYVFSPYPYLFFLPRDKCGLWLYEFTTEQATLLKTSWKLCERASKLYLSSEELSGGKL